VEVIIMNTAAVRATYIIAGDSEAPNELLAYFIVHYDHKIRARVAGNPALTQEQIFELTNDPSPEVRAAVAENPAIPFAFLEMLAEDDSPDVRFAIAENANMPTYILSLLARDENPYVSERALKTLEKVWPRSVSFAA
jgi:hypothetical protein